jgi:hypothetical protein
MRTVKRASGLNIKASIIDVLKMAVAFSLPIEK